MTDDFFVAPDLEPNSSDCQSVIVTKWFELAPGESWELAIDMSGCAPEELCTFYGHISKKNSSPLLSRKDGVVLSLYDQNMDAEVTSRSRCRAVSSEDTTTVVLTATNNGRKKVRIRLSFQASSSQ